MKLQELVGELRDELEFANADNEDLRESVYDLQRAVDELGWKPLGFNTVEELGMQIDALRRLTETTRPLYAANPIVKRGISARVGYIWGEGVDVEGRSYKNLVARNRKTLFSREAHTAIEGAAATDGNIIFLLDKQKRKARTMPLSQMAEYATDPDNDSEIWFIKRSWTRTAIASSTTQTTREERKEWIPTLEFLASGEKLPARIGDVKVARGQAVCIVSVNRQAGWIWGVPDLLPALFWSKSYKEFLESQYTLTRSLSRYAYKVVDKRPTGAGAKKAAIKLANPANYDADSRQRSDAGGTVAMGQGLDLMAVNKAGANVDYAAGRPLAAMVAAALEVPLTTVLAESSAASDDALDIPTVKAAQARQRLWADKLEEILEYLGGSQVKVTFPPIQAAPIHRVIQSIITAASAGVLFPAEVRDLMIKALRSYGIDPKSGLPEPGEWRQYATAGANNPGTSPQKTPNDTDTPGPGDDSRTAGGALADGDHEMRDSEE